MSRSNLALVGLVASLAVASSGCLVNRRIDEVISHPTHNSYKIQTEDAYWAFLSAWTEWSVWNCYQTRETFRCNKVDYETRTAGFKPKADALPGSPVKAAPQEPPAAPAPEAPTAAAPPTAPQATTTAQPTEGPR